MSLLKIMFATLQSLLCRVMPGLLQWSGQMLHAHNQRSDIENINVFMAHTAVQLCLLAGEKLEDVDLTSGVPMLREYMTTMALDRIPDGTYNTLIDISPENRRGSTTYVYEMTTVYAKKSHGVHSTEGLSYSEYCVEDHLAKTNLSIKDDDNCILNEDGGPGEGRRAQLDYFFMTDKVWFV
jgi:hypothetical protein